MPAPALVPAGAALLAAALLSPAPALAVTFSFPSTMEHGGLFNVSAYRDEGGRDWACGSNYYSGHGGTDLAIGGFGPMAAGRDIAAAYGGTVVMATDGFFDQCTTGGCPGGSGCGNYVKIQHDDGTAALYCHMKSGSVAVSTGDTVTCGQVIGQVGSSGNSTGPHLHFEPRTSGNVGYDPFAGSCSPAPSSYWNEQGPHNGLPAVTCEGGCGEPIVVDDQDDGFSFTDGGGSVNSEGAGNGGHFYWQAPFDGEVPYVRGEWVPEFEETNLYQVSVYLPDSAYAQVGQANFLVAFQGGYAVATVDMSAGDNDWHDLIPDTPLKFVEGEQNRVSLFNITAFGGENDYFAWDAVRWTCMGPTGNGDVGDSCDLSGDCVDELVCVDGDCAEPCQASGCTQGECDSAAGVCIVGDPGSEDVSEPWWNPDPDEDTDGDGIPDYEEGNVDSDGDGFLDWLDEDSDNDGIPDSEEGDGDRDNDGIPNYLDDDSDGDGISDADEVGDDPEDPRDSDGDGVPDFLDPDADGDGVADVYEVGEDPQDPADHDGDGTPDYLDTDSDDDGIDDGDEWGPDPENPRDTDGDGIPDVYDDDSDNDGVPDSVEGNVDSDGDGVPDYLDLDSDNDGIPDGEDEDRDGDGVPDDLLGGDADTWIPEDDGCNCGQSVSSLGGGGPRDAGARAGLALLGAALLFGRRSRQRRP
jgi:hypothetical protein